MSSGVKSNTSESDYSALCMRLVYMILIKEKPNNFGETDRNVNGKKNTC